VLSQNQIGFGGSVSRPDVVQDDLSIQEIYPSSMAVRSFVYHLDYHKVSLPEEF